MVLSFGDAMCGEDDVVIDVGMCVLASFVF